MILVPGVSLRNSTSVKLATRARKDFFLLFFFFSEYFTKNRERTCTQEEPPTALNDKQLPHQLLSCTENNYGLKMTPSREKSVRHRLWRVALLDADAERKGKYN